MNSTETNDGVTDCEVVNIVDTGLSSEQPKLRRKNRVIFTASLEVRHGKVGYKCPFPSQCGDFFGKNLAEHLTTSAHGSLPLYLAKKLVVKLKSVRRNFFPRGCVLTVRDESKETIGYRIEGPPPKSKVFWKAVLPITKEMKEKRRQRRNRRKGKCLWVQQCSASEEDSTDEKTDKEEAECTTKDLESSEKSSGFNPKRFHGEKMNAVHVRRSKRLKNNKVVTEIQQIDDASLKDTLVPENDRTEVQEDLDKIHEEVENQLSLILTSVENTVNEPTFIPHKTGDIPITGKFVEENTGDVDCQLVGILKNETWRFKEYGFVKQDPDNPKAPPVFVARMLPSSEGKLTINIPPIQVDIPGLSIQTIQLPPIPVPGVVPSPVKKEILF